MGLPADSPAGVLAAALVALEPVDASPDRRARILARVLQRHGARRFRLFARLSPAVVSIAVLSMGIGAAAATLAPRFGWRWAVPARGWTTCAALPSGPARSTAGDRTAAGQVAVSPPLAGPPRLAFPVRRAPAEDSPARLMAAVRALRSEGRPARAQRLALEYLRVSPRGALAEEALALAVEAAARSGDAQAATLAARYLRQYPAGRFRAVAEEARALLR